MSRIMNRYGLRNKKTGELATYSTSNNEGGCDCVSTSYDIGLGGEHEWLVEDAVNAEYVRLNSTEWYNAGYETPSHSGKWDADEWEVVEVKMVVSAVDVKIPTIPEYYKERYEKTDPDHYRNVMKMLAESRDVRYSLYDLREHIRK